RARGPGAGVVLERVAHRVADRDGILAGARGVVEPGADELGQRTGHAVLVGTSEQRRDLRCNLRLAKRQRLAIEDAGRAADRLRDEAEGRALTDRIGAGEPDDRWLGAAGDASDELVP